jgi:ketosteroid isomerase-like protein
MSDPERRGDRWEPVVEIQQLAARYAIALDGRDPVSWAALYTPDVRVGPPIDGSGHEDLQRWFRAKCSYWYRSMHLIGAHQVDLADPDDPDADPDVGTGLVQCRVEQEIGERWVTTALLYRDSYRRVDGRWLFAHRHGLPLWAYDQHTDPLEGFQRLPGGMPIRLPADYPAFRPFWADFTDEQVAAVTRSPI